MTTASQRQWRRVPNAGRGPRIGVDAAGQQPHMKNRLRIVLALVLLTAAGVAKPCCGSASEPAREEQPTERGRRLGLALSGGGFRAAGFHLGVLRKMDSLGLLDDVEVISCVSGGCIVTGILALNWDQPDRLDRIEEYIKTDRSSLVTRSFLDALFDPCESRVESLAQSYDEDLFHGATLGDLGHAPRVMFNATNSASGKRFSFSAGRAKGVAGAPTEALMRDHTVGEFPADDLPLARIVAASSAFPPVFNPMPFEVPSSEGPREVTLTDGGVYDNLGANPFIYSKKDPGDDEDADKHLGHDWKAAVDYAIVSDGGEPFPMDQDAASSGLGVIARLPYIQMEKIRGLTIRLLLTRLEAGEDSPVPLLFSINSEEGEAEEGDAKEASSVATGLSGLDGPTLARLTRHGGALLEARLQAYAPELLP